MTQQAEILPMETKIAVYAPFRSQLAEMKEQNKSLVFEYETPKGNKDARSYIYKLRQTKSAIEVARKEEKAASLEYGRKVDAEAKEITIELEAMIEVHQKVIDEIENREKQRVAEHEQGIADIISLGNQSMNGWQSLSLNDMKDALSRLSNQSNIDWEEFKERAEAEIAAAVENTRLAIEKREVYDAEQAELKRLREESAARDKKDHEDRIAAEAAEKAKLEAERKAKEEADKVEAARLESERIAKIETDRIEREKREAVERAEKAEADKLAAIAKAEADRIAAEKKAEQDKQEAIEAEKKRQADESAKIAVETAKREADKKHRAKINNEILDALAMVGVDKGISIQLGKLIIEAIVNGKIPHVKIIY